MGHGNWFRRGRRRARNGKQAGGAAKRVGDFGPPALKRIYAFEPLEDRRMLATFLVTNLGDTEINDDGERETTAGSLRAAIEAANAEPNFDIILFADGLTGTISLLDGEVLEISNSVRILGPTPQKITIQADNNFRIFEIGGGGGGGGGDLISVEISGMTLSGGRAMTGSADERRGGAILNNSNLLMNEVVITNNFAPFGGGAIFHESGDLQISRSLIMNNTAGGVGGGGILIGDEEEGNADNPTTATISDSTLTGNRATSAAQYQGYGGGLLNRRGFITISNSTIILNTSVGDGAGVASWGNEPGEAPEEGEDPEPPPPTVDTIIISNIFFFNNGPSDIAVVGPPVEQDEEMVDLEPSITNDGFNDIGVAEDRVPDGENDISVDPMFVSDALGNPVLRNFGGSTSVFLPDFGSPVIDAGEVGPGVSFFDQRGRHFTREFGAAADIGAAETQEANFVVDILLDETDRQFSDVNPNAGDAYTFGDFSLREAIENSAANPNVDTITFIDFRNSGTDPTISPAPTINLTLRPNLTINHSVNIIGPADWVLEIDASGNDPTPLVNNADGTRVFSIDDGDSANLRNVSISNLTIIGGDTAGSGGGIFSRENLTLSNVAVMDNAASNDGGGVFIQFGTLTIENSTIGNNRAADDGGGIYIETGTTIPVVNLKQVTVSTNVAGDRGAGIYNNGSDLTIEYSTIASNNSASTFGSGIANTGAGAKTSLKSTIVAGNANRDIEAFLGATSATFTSLGYNLIGNGNSSGVFVAIGDQSNVLNPMLAPLVVTGGLLATQRPIVGSPAIDRGDPAAAAGQAGVPEFDQRGGTFARVFDGNNDGVARIDVGAYELQPALLIVDSESDVSDGNFGPGQFTLREAIEISNQNPLVDIINFAPNVRVITTGGTQRNTLLITDSVQIIGPSSIDLAVQAAQVSQQQISLADKIFTIDNGQASLIDVEISGMEIRNAQVGAIFSRENVTLTDVTLLNNRTLTNGGGVYHELGSFKLVNSLVTGNTTTTTGGKGGGLYFANVNGASKVEIEYSTVAGNSTVMTGGHGAGIFVKNSRLEARQSTVAGNTTLAGAADGAGMYFEDASALLEETTVSGNSTIGANSEGAGLAVAGLSVVTLTKTSLLALNTTIGSQSPGAGAVVFGGVLNIDNGVVVQNHTTGLTSPGGGIAIFGGAVNLFGTTVLQNTTASSDGHGGGIANFGGNLLVRDSTISNNQVLHATSKGGGVYSDTNLAGTQVTLILNSTISGNSSPLRGGGVFNADGRTDIKHSTITNNSVPFFNVGAGVASQANASTLTTVFSSIIAGNVGVTETPATASDVDFVDAAFTNSYQSLGYNIIGIGNAIPFFNAAGDKTGIVNPLLGALNPNGGLTNTHALLTGSPAINAGSPTFSPNAYIPALTSDQRGAGFARVNGGRLDVGAYESSFSAFSADFDGDSDVDGADFLKWQRGIGSGTTAAEGDANGDGVVNGADLTHWTSEFGGTAASAALAPLAVGGGDEEEPVAAFAVRLADESVAAGMASFMSATLIETPSLEMPIGAVVSVAGAGVPGGVAATRSVERRISPTRYATDAAQLRRAAAIDASIADGRVRLADATDSFAEDDVDRFDGFHDDAIFALLGESAL